MRRDPHTGAPDFFRFARDYLHAYMPKTGGLSPKTIEAYRISLECFLDYLTEAERIGRERVSFDHFDRQHLKGWLTWMTDQRHYTPKTVTLRLSAVEAFLAYAAYEDLPRSSRSADEPGTQSAAGARPGPSGWLDRSLERRRSLPRSPGRQRNLGETGCC